MSNAATEYANGEMPSKCTTCGGKVYDNRAKKASGEYGPTSKDWSCASKTCMTDGYRTGGWVKDKAKSDNSDLHGEPPLDESQADWEEV